MEIYRPIHSNYWTQQFGKSMACVNRQGRVIAKKGNFCSAGYQSFYESIGMKGHNGVDMASWYREPVFFPVNADTKWYAKTEKDYAGGLGVDIFSVSPLKFDVLPPHTGDQARKLWSENGKMLRVKFRFWHGDANAVGENQSVELGTFIQYSDSTGASSGNHLHWSMKFVDDNDRTLDTNNGYRGAVDFAAYYIDWYVLDYLGVKKKVLSLKEQVDRLVFEVTMFIRQLTK